MTVLDDIRYSARLLVRAPAFAVAAVLTLGLGIGAGTAVFSAVDTILRRPPHLAGLIRISPLEDGRGRHVRLDDLETWRAAVPEHVFTAYSVGAVNIGVDVSAAQARRVERVAAAAVDHQYFAVLRAATIQGRTFGERTETNVAVVSEALWSRQLLAGPDVVGTSLTVDGVPHTIIGILPDEHRFPRSDVALWRPLGPRAEGVTVIGRVPRTTPLEPLRARLESAQPGQQAIGPNAGIRIDWFDETLLTGRLRAAAAVGRATVVFVLLIACANVANLLVARNVGRRAEFAARIAFGAGRWRLVRQLLTESALIASLGGALGVGVAMAATGALMRAWQTIPDARPFAPSVEFGTTMLLWALGGAAAATLVAGVIPAWHGTRLAPRAVLAEHGHTATTSRGGAGLQRVLVALQIAFAFALVTGAMLLARSFTALQSADVGFAVDQVFTFQVAPGPGSEPAAPLHAQLDERVRSLPGVLAVGRATHVPLEGDVPRTSYRLGSPAQPSEAWTAAIRHVNAGYHAALEIPILDGRGFGSAPADGIVVSRRLARRHWPDRSPVGEVLRVDGEPHVIIGVAGDTREWGPHADAPALIYEHHPGGDTWVLRLAPGSSPVAGAIRSIVTEVDTNAAVHDALSMRERLRRNTARSELLATTMTVFAAVALLLAAFGVHASLAHATARRARELAIRSALGASPAAVARLVLRQGVGLAASGVLAGACLAVGTGRVLQAFLPNISQQDPAALLGAGGALTAAIVLACGAAMRRAASAEPLDALRERRAQ
jgi:predicted permease